MIKCSENQGFEGKRSGSLVRSQPLASGLVARPVRSSVLKPVSSNVLGPVFIVGCPSGLPAAAGHGPRARAASPGRGRFYLLRMLATTAIYHPPDSHRSTRPPNWLLFWLGAVGWGLRQGRWARAGGSSHPQSPSLRRHRSGSPQPPGALRGWARLLAFPGRLAAAAFLFPERLPRTWRLIRCLRLIDRLHVPAGRRPGLVVRSPWAAFPCWRAYCPAPQCCSTGVATVEFLGPPSGRPSRFAPMITAATIGLVALLTLGEGWHNLQPAFRHRRGKGHPAAGRLRACGSTYGFIRFLERCGLASRLIVSKPR